MKITKNGFYKLSEIYSEKITIEKNLVVAIFDDLNKSYDVEVLENSKVEIFGIIKDVDNFKLQVIQKEDRSNLLLNYLLLSKDGENIKAKIESKLQANFVNSNVNILSIVGNGGIIDLDGIIKIEEKIKKVEGNLIEENIFLGDSGKVKGIPTLLVRSDDVKASHACRIEKISDEKLFYLRSRGIEREDSLNMIIEAKIQNIFGNLSLIDNDFYNELIKTILLKLK